MSQNFVSDGVKGGDHRLRDFDQVSEHWKHWRISDAHGGLIKRYLQDDFRIVLRRKEPATRRSRWELEQDGFAFSVAPNSGVGREHRQSNTARNRQELNQTSVLPYNVQIIEKEQRFVRSTVRSYFFDRGDFSLSKQIFAFVGFQRVEKIGLPFVDGEMQIGIRFHATSSKERSEQDIQATPEGVYDRACLRIRDGIDRSQAVTNHQHVARAIRIRLHDDVIWAAPDEGFESLFERWDLGYGPVNRGLGI
jgi:hypothetical protein